MIALFFFFTLAASFPKEAVTSNSGAPWPTRARHATVSTAPPSLPKEPCVYPTECKENSWWIPTLIGTGLIGGGSAAIATILGDEEPVAAPINTSNSLTFTLSNSDDEEGSVAGLYLPNGRLLTSLTIPANGSSTITIEKALSGGHLVVLTSQPSPLEHYLLTIQVNGVTVDTKNFLENPGTASYHNH